MVTVNWTPEMLKRFKAALAEANRKADIDFEFDGHTFVTAYAEHLVIYLDDVLASAETVH